MIRKQEGFTLVELLITMVLFIITIAAATNIFVPLLTQFKQQSKSAETQIEGIVGLETLRRDIEQAGYGLPWSIPSTVSYQEAAGSPASNYNDSPSSVPRAILSGNDVATAGLSTASDRLVIKSITAGMSNATTKWTYISGGAAGGNIRTWGTADDPSPTDRVIVLIPSRGSFETSQRILAANGSTFSVQFSQVAANFSPSLLYDKYLIYGVDADTNLRMPFNRADYYVKKPATNMPQRCASGTGILYKATLNHANGLFTELPLVDCVADMEIVYGLDTKNDGNISYFHDISNGTTYPAQTIRDQLKEVHLYILAQEGQKDSSYTFNNFTPGACSTCIRVGEFGLGNDFNLTNITDYQNYRWKVYNLVVKPKNLL